MSRSFRYASVCSGIEAASIAWSTFGWELAWLSEIEPYCCSLLEHYYPGKNRGSITEITKTDGEEEIDIIVGGTPCQSYSVTGKRGGITDPRGNLTREYIRVLREYAPAWFIWENVPGVFSAGSGHDFEAITQEMGASGYALCWRVLDASRFGVSQNRRRCFIVGRRGAANWRQAAEVLFAEDAIGTDQDTAAALQQERSADTRASIIGYNGDETPKFSVGEHATPTLRAYQGGEGAGFMTYDGAYKYTPVEYERLMGVMPENYTLIMHNGKPASDKMRIQALGNSFVVPILRWLGRRISQAHIG